MAIVPKTPRFRIKICGIRTGDDLKACRDAGADCVGLNFFPKSLRFLDPCATQTSMLCQQAGDLGLVRVGLFVNSVFDQVLHACDDLSLDAVQLHGDETPEFAQMLLEHGIPVIRAIRLPTNSMTPEAIDEVIGPWNGVSVTRLLDADAGSAFGGSGKQLDWPSLARWSQSQESDWILAGGLKPGNVAEAIQVSQATQIDVASGVEEPKGRKSPRLIQEFVENALARLKI